MISCLAVVGLFAIALTAAAITGRRLPNPADQAVTVRDRIGIAHNTVVSVSTDFDALGQVATALRDVYDAMTDLVLAR